MRVVTPEEAVSSIDSGDQVYVHCAAAAPSALLDALVAHAQAADLTDIGVTHLHIEGPGPHLAPEMARHFRHRALFVGPNARRAVERRSRRLRPGLPFRRAPPLHVGSPAARRRARQRDASGQPRLLFARHVGRGDARGDPGGEDGHRPVQPGDATDARRELHPRGRDRPRSRGRRTARTSARSGRSAMSNAGSARSSPISIPDGATLQLGIGAIPARDRAGPAQQARPGDPHGDVHGLGRRSRRGRRRHRRRARSATAARS